MEKLLQRAQQNGEIQIDDLQAAAMFCVYGQLGILLADELTQEDKHIRVCFIDAFSIKTEAEFYRIFAREVISCAASTLEKRLEDVKQVS